MIHYALRCGSGHEFDGWFKNSLAFEAQASGALLSCPACGATTVERALMAPRLGRGAKAPRPAAAVAETPTAPSATAPTAPSAPATQSAGDNAMVAAAHALPDQVRALLQRVRSEVERRCDYVGDRFADEARRIHAGDAAARPIYGETTPDQAEALAEDGIEVARIPWVDRADG